MKFIFIGDPNDNFSGSYNKEGVEVEIIVVQGVEFKKGEAVSVTDKALIDILKGHSHFDVEKKAKPKKTDVS